MQHHTKLLFILGAAFFIALAIASCGKRPALIPLSIQQVPDLTDYGNRVELIHAVNRHLDYLHALPSGQKISIGRCTYPLSWMIESTKLFLQLIEETNSPDELSQKVQARFDLFQASGREGLSGQQMLITGYYEPVLEGSLKHEGPYRWPLYTVPADLVSRVVKNKTEVYRKTGDSTMLPYWSRQEIEEHSYLKGYELVYLKDPFDAFTIHVQGSAKIQLPDGSVRSVHYAGSNGRPYSSIGKLMVDRGIMVREEVTMEKIGKYIHEHPDERKDILYHNKKYIFFQWAADNGAPRGSAGVELTPERSIAIDTKTLPASALGFLITRKPLFAENGDFTGWQDFNRFVLPQDSGAAIKGAGRVDLFLGNSHEAQKAAGLMQEEGKLYFLIKKGYVAGKQ